MPSSSKYKIRYQDNIDEGIEPESNECNHDGDEKTTVMYLQDALKAIDAHSYSSCQTKDNGTGEANDSHSNGLRCQPFSSPLLVMEKYSLNDLQGKAFKLVVRELIMRMAQGYDPESYPKDSNAKENINSFSIYLGGEAGTGKTRVVEAIIEFCSSWGRSNAIRTCAPTGMAASLVKGQTLHSLLGIHGKRSSFNPKPRLPRKIIEEYEDTLMLIVDEVSMMNRKILAALDAFLRKVKERNSPFGGVMIMFCGDLFQIPPVASDTVYTDSNNSRHNGNIDDTLVYELWISLDYAVILTESVRQKDDDIFSECLRRVRYGKTTKEDFELLNSRVLTTSFFQSCVNFEKDTFLSSLEAMI